MHHLKTGFLVPVLFLLAFASCSKEPAASFEFDQNNVKAPATITFTNSSVNAVEYLWAFGDGETSREPNPIHTYRKGGDYEVSLKAYGEDGSHSITKTITILPNMTGHWNVTFLFGQMNMQARMNIEEMANHSLTGEFALAGDSVYTPVLSSSLIDGFDVKIDVLLFNYYEINFKGTINSAYNSMSGEFDFAGRPGGPWSAAKFQ